MPSFPSPFGGKTSSTPPLPIYQGGLPRSAPHASLPGSLHEPSERTPLTSPPAPYLPPRPPVLSSDEGFSDEGFSDGRGPPPDDGHYGCVLTWVVLLSLVAGFGGALYASLAGGGGGGYAGPYRLVEEMRGRAFLDGFDFFNGTDSEGSKGFQNYVGAGVALETGLASFPPKGGGGEAGSTVRLSSAPSALGPRRAIRLEGRRRFNRGLFIADVLHMPAGCGTWPALWLTDEGGWPGHGEIDVVESANTQDRAKTALHTSE